MISCNECKFEIVEDSLTVCPNCGAALVKSESSDNAMEQSSPKTMADDKSDDDNLQICDPGELLYAEQPENNVPEDNSPVSRSVPLPSSPSSNDSENKNRASLSSEDCPGSIKKLSDEQVNNIRSNLLKSDSDSEYVSAQDASSIIHDLSKSNEGPTLQRKDADKPVDTKANRSADQSASAPDTKPPQPIPENPMPPPAKAPMRKVAYFHKNFIQLTGSLHPSSGEELVIEDRYYLLKPKKIKPQYTIGIFSVLVLLLLFVVGRQFISPTLPGSGSIIGVILDEQGRPLITGAEISLPESGKKVKSDAIGFFRFSNVPTGVYIIRYTLDNGRMGAENISVAKDEVTTLSLSTVGAREKYTSVTNNGNDDRQSAKSSTSNRSSSMPPVPEEKKQQALNESKTQKEYSTLRLKANVDGAKLIVNGDVLGSGNLTYKKLMPGTHQAKVTKNGYNSWSGNIDLRANETYTLSVTLDKIPVQADETTYSAEDFYQSGKTMFADGNIDAAIQDFSEAINMKPSMADAFMSRAEAYKAASKSILAENDYIKAGEIYASQKRNESALTCFNEAIGLNDKSVTALINRGDLYNILDVKNKALDDFQDAVKYDKENFRANFELGKIYFSIGNHKDADKRLRNARDIDPRNPEVYHYLMLNYFARDDFNKVKKTYADFKDNIPSDQQQAFKTNPRFDAIRRIVGEYERP